KVASKFATWSRPQIVKVARPIVGTWSSSRIGDPGRWPASEALIWWQGFARATSSPRESLRKAANKKGLLGQWALCSIPLIPAFAMLEFVPAPAVPTPFLGIDSDSQRAAVAVLLVSGALLPPLLRGALERTSKQKPQLDRLSDVARAA